MITDKDIIKLKEVFATKEDLLRFATKDDIKNMATKSDLAEIMGELRAIREELTVGSYRRLEMSEAIESHDVRISTLENKLAFPE